MELLGCRRQIKELSLSKRKMSMQVQELEGQVRKLANLQDTEEMLRKEEENAALRHAYDDMQAQVRRRGGKEHAVCVLGADQETFSGRALLGSAESTVDQ